MLKVLTEYCRRGWVGFDFAEGKEVVWRFYGRVEKMRGSERSQEGRIQVMDRVLSRLVSLKIRLKTDMMPSLQKTSELP